MSDIVLSDGERSALKYLVTVGPVFAKDIDFPEYWDFVRLKTLGFAKMELPDPNFLYLLPDDRHEAYQFKITGPGYNEYLRLEQARNERAHQEEQRKADRAEDIKNQKKNRRHDFAVAAFGGVVTLFVEHINDVMHLLDVAIKHVISLFH